ncbi:hypothetical protein FEDK69T_03210 [Flavobacterium enshiense DK69]|uniref:Chromosome partitioning protein ParA n=1 Tax=Flavobacterium enshiense DK69 TaxID=1107311 RepID=V6SE83_9FLAO|nr:hypothetical protein [Flavobacterium enshiense]ESU24769.1 hypothetical protein FEDK69T_03210 [Flavobacterium enshiense DK69]KGO96777.1 hypothetical protein Q767_03465 [Flavobacterium enshiense DK69]
MENQKSNSSLKAIIVVLVLLLLGSLGYMYKMSTDNQTSENKMMSEKEKLSEELQASIAKYDEAIAANTELSDELAAEREKLVQLKAELEKSQGDVASLRKFKDSYARLKREMDNLMKENDELKKQNTVLATQRDSTQVVLEDTRKVRDTLVAKNDNLAKTVERGSKLSVLNLQTTAVKQRSSGKQIDTDKASRADVLKISFMIAENQIAKSGDKTYHIQVIDSKNNVLGEKKTESFGEKTLTYSFEKTVKYENKTVQVSQDLPVKDIEGGTFYVNIFDKGELVSKTSFTLR